LSSGTRALDSDWLSVEAASVGELFVDFAALAVDAAPGGGATMRMGFLSCEELKTTGVVELAALEASVASQVADLTAPGAVAGFASVGTPVEVIG
jgi:hypothetical protein